jgi:hypothetical protein
MGSLVVRIDSARDDARSRLAGQYDVGRRGGWSRAPGGRMAGLNMQGTGPKPEHRGLGEDHHPDAGFSPGPVAK